MHYKINGKNHLKCSNDKCKQCILNKKNPCRKLLVIIQISKHHQLFLNEQLKKKDMIMTITNITQSKYHDKLKDDKIEGDSLITGHDQNHNHYSYQKNVDTTKIINKVYYI